MEVVDLEAKLGGNDHGHKRSDLDLDKGAGGVVQGGDSKRPREGGDDDSRCMEMEEAYFDFQLHRKKWLQMYGENGAISFEDETDYPCMRFTDVKVLPSGARASDILEIFFVKVSQITRGLQWPLDVYGIVAVRDSIDRKRNYLFRRGRDNCQTLTSLQDSLLELTGPIRAILLWDEPVFEIDLKVKGKGSSSEDKVLCLDFFGYSNISYKGNVSYATTEVVSSKHSTVEVMFAHLKRSVEATITIRISNGSANFSAILTACNVSLGEDVVLLDTRGQEVSITKDGEVTLHRHVVGVEDRGDLVLSIKAEQLGDTAENRVKVDKKIIFEAKSALRNAGCINMGFACLDVVVAWSLLA